MHKPSERSRPKQVPKGVAAARAPRSARIRGFSLIELVTALAISSLIVVAMGSAVMVASAAIPSTVDESKTQAATGLDWIMLEVSEAEQIKSATNNALTFIVPDRDGDGQTELVSYTWSGVRGEPLYRAFNNAAAVVYLDEVRDFAVTTTTTTSNLGLSIAISRSRYTSITVSIIPARFTRTLTKSVVLPNEPRVLDLWVRTDFDNGIDVTSFDRNYSGEDDWTMTGAHNPNTISGGLWNADAAINVRAPGNITAPTTIAMRLAIGEVNNYAQLYTLADVAGLTGGGIRLTVTANAGGYAIRLEHVTTLVWITLITTTADPGPLDVALVVNPKNDRVILVVNGTEVGSRGYTRLGVGSSGAIQINRSGSKVFIDWIDVRIGGTS